MGTALTSALRTASTTYSGQPGSRCAMASAGETAAVAGAAALGGAAAAYCWLLPSSPGSAGADRTPSISRPTRSAADFDASRNPRAGALVVFNGPSSAGKSTLVKAVQEELARRGGVPLCAEYVYLRAAYDDLDVLLPQNTLPDLFVFEEGGAMRLRQPGESGAGGKQPGELSFNGPDGTAVYWFEDRRSELPGGLEANPAQSIINHPIADSCLRGQHRSWTALCAAGNNVLVDHWIQEPWWKADLDASLRESAAESAAPSAVRYIHVDCDLAELERREGSRGDRVLGTSRWSKEHGPSLKHGDGSEYELCLDSGKQTTEEMVSAVLGSMAEWELLP